MSGSYYALNTKYNQLLALLNAIISGGGGGVPTSSDLAVVLDNGNSAGTFDIDMNNNDILQVDNIDLVTINNLPYPPTGTQNYEDVLTVGNIANELTAILTGTGTVGTATATNSKASIVINDSDGAGTIVQSSLNNNTLQMIAGIPIGYGQNLTLNLNTGGSQCGISHSDTNPSSPSPFTINTDQNLQLSTGATKYFLVDSVNIEGTASYWKFGDVATEYSTQTIQGFNAFDINNSNYSYYRNNQFSIFGTGSASLYANKSNLVYTDSAGTGTGAISSNQVVFQNPTTGNSLYNAGSATISSSNSAGATAPVLTINNSFAGASAGVAIETYKNQLTAGTIGDEVFRLSMFGKNSTNAKEEYGRITCNIRDPSIPGAGADGQLLLAVPVGDAMTTFLDLNGNNGRINALREVDIRTNDIISTTGSVHLNASASAGIGQVILEPKVGSNIIMKNLPTSAVGLTSGMVYILGTVLNIVP